ncbi:MAG: DUF262 domain-containing protein, partial [Cetobacterium sp.]|uniref:DUF262 domain-containing protein n=1 Tax=Cetobacterium sp. TaxID=2071632 RepID=UPI003F2F4924
MKEEILNWLSKKAININYLDNNEFIHIEENIQLYFREKDFKISELTNIWKWYFQNKVNIYSDENINKLKEYIEEVMEFNENYNYDQDDVYVREIVTQTGFSSLISQFERNFFVIPKSQRNYVWTKEKVENLAVSLVRGLPIPPIYAYRNNQNQLVVLDGQQRLTSLYLYSKGIYISGKEKNNAINLKSVLSDENKLSVKEEENSFLKKLDDNFTVEKVDYRLRTIGGFSQNINYESLNPEIKALVDTRALTIIEILVMGTDNKEEVYYNIFGN